MLTNIARTEDKAIGTETVPALSSAAQKSSKIKGVKLWKDTTRSLQKK